MDLDTAILEAVEAEDRVVSIAMAIRRVREATGTELSDADLQTEIGSLAAEHGKKILFDLHPRGS